MYGLRRVYGQVDDLPVDTQAVKFRIERTCALKTELAVFVQTGRVECFYPVQGDGFEVERLAVGLGNPSVDFKLLSLVLTSRGQHREGGHGTYHFFHLGIMCLQTVYKDKGFQLSPEE